MVGYRVVVRTDTGFQSGVIYIAIGVDANAFLDTKRTLEFEDGWIVTGWVVDIYER